MRRSDPRWQPGNFEKNLEATRLLSELAESKGAPSPTGSRLARRPAAEHRPNPRNPQSRATRGKHLGRRPGPELYGPGPDYRNPTHRRVRRPLRQKHPRLGIDRKPATRGQQEDNPHNRRWLVQSIAKQERCSVLVAKACLSPIGGPSLSSFSSLT